MKRNFFKFFSYMLIAGFTAFGFGSCSKDTTNPSEPPKPKTEAEKQADLKEELRTTMKFNTNYKNKLYDISMGALSLANFNPTSHSTEKDLSNTDIGKSSAASVVIDKRGRLWYCAGSDSYYRYDKYTIKKEGTKFTVTADYKDGVVDVRAESVDGTDKVTESPEDGATGTAASLTFTYDTKSLETLVIIQLYRKDIASMANPILWVQDKSISKPVKSPGSVFDPATYIDF